MKKINTYCQLEFLKFLFHSIPSIPFSDLLLKKDEGLNAYTNIFNLIYKKSNLNLDIQNIAELTQLAKINPYFQRLINENNSGGSKIVNNSFTLNKKDFLEKIAASSILLYYKELKQEYDFFIATKENWPEKVSNISNRISYTIHTHEFYNNFSGWQFLSNINLPTNAAIISDRYFLIRENNYRYNLFSILKNLIANNITKKFHLSIITEPNNLRDEQKVFNIINRFLNKSFKNKIEFNLFLPNNRLCPHDRDIFTNYYRLSSQNSFDYFDNNGNINVKTQLDFIPISSGDYDNHFNKISELKYIISKSRKLGNRNYRNRLLDNLT